MIALLDYLSIIQYQNSVTVGYGCQPVGDNKHRYPVVLQPPDSVLELRLAEGVQVAGCLIKHNNVRPAQ